MKREDKDWIESSGNVFEDMGFEKHEAEILKAKAQVMNELEKFIKTKNLTQAQAAEILGVPRPRINRLLKGDFRNITLDKMGEMVSRAGMTLEVKVRKPRRRSASKSAAAAWRSAQYPARQIGIYYWVCARFPLAQLLS